MEDTDIGIFAYAYICVCVCIYVHMCGCKREREGGGEWGRERVYSRSKESNLLNRASISPRQPSRLAVKGKRQEKNARRRKRQNTNLEQFRCSSRYIVVHKIPHKTWYPHISPRWIRGEFSIGIEQYMWVCACVCVSFFVRVHGLSFYLCWGGFTVSHGSQFYLIYYRLLNGWSFGNQRTMRLKHWLPLVTLISPLTHIKQSYT